MAGRELTEPGATNGSRATSGPRPALAVSLRRPTEADHGPIVGVIDDWWAVRRSHTALPRLWLRHFAGSSWIAEDESGRLAGFLVGFVSPDRPDEAVVHLVGVAPDVRRRGVGRALVERFAGDVASRGARRLEAVVPPDDRAALGFLRALGFRPLEGPGIVRLWGTPAVADYDWDGADRAILVRER